MPVPILLVGLGIAAGALGVGGHLSAQETNEKAQKLSEDAQNLYNQEKNILEDAKRTTEETLLELGYSKKNTLDHSMKKFLNAYEKVKNIKMTDSVGMNEISKFAIAPQEALELQKMSDIYSESISSGASGAAAGAVIALAASGSLPVVTGGLSLAGSALMMGDIGAAAGIAGSALSFGAAMTPLAAVAAPVVLFTGISASMKADENLEKAEEMYAEAEAAVEKMKVSETLCNAITKRSDMFNDLLVELDGMFSECTNVLEAVIRKKERHLGGKNITAEDLTQEELKLIAVTRALAGAIKAVIDTPILSKDGKVSVESKKIFDQTSEKLPDFSGAVAEIQSYDYGVTIKNTTDDLDEKVKNTIESLKTTVSAKIILTVVFGLLVVFRTHSFISGILAWSIVALMVMDNSNIFKVVKHVASWGMALSFVIMFYRNCRILLEMRHFILFNIMVLFVSLLLMGFSMSSNNKKIGNVRKTIVRVSGSVFFFSLALLTVAFLHGILHLPLKFTIILIGLIYALFAWSCAYMVDEM